MLYCCCIPFTILLPKAKLNLAFAVPPAIDIVPLALELSVTESCALLTYTVDPLGNVPNATPSGVELLHLFPPPHATIIKDNINNIGHNITLCIANPLKNLSY